MSNDFVYEIDLVPTPPVECSYFPSNKEDQPKGDLAQSQTEIKKPERQRHLQRLVFIQVNTETGQRELVPRHIEKEFTFRLAEKGFLSQTFGCYAPVCNTCRACVPLRVNTDKFKISQSQQKLIDTSGFSFQVYASNEIDDDIGLFYVLYKKYISQRHMERSSGMNKWNFSDFKEWFFESPLKLVAKDNSRIIGFSCLDGHNENLSLYYSVFDPSAAKQSPGKQLWLATICLAQEWDVQHVYVGPWAKDSPKLDYKKNHSGLEAYINGQWVDFDSSNTTHWAGPDYLATFKDNGLSL